MQDQYSLHSSPGQRPGRRLLAGLLAMFAFMPANVGAQTSSPAGSGNGGTEAPASVHEARMERDVEALRGYIEAEITDLENSLEGTELDDQTRELIDGWKAYLRGQTETALENENPRQELLDLWALVEQVKALVESQSAPDQLGPAHGEVQEATEAIHQGILQAARRYLPEQALQRSRDSISQFVASNPINFSQLTQRSANGISQSLFTVFNAGRETLGAIASVPLLPSRAAAGIQEGTDQLARFNQTAAEFNQIVAGMPEEIRRETVTLLDNISDQQTTLSTLLRDLSQTARSFEQTALAADRLTSRVERTLGASTEAAAAYRETARAVEGASRASEQLVTAIERLMRQTRPTTEGTSTASGGGFEITEYREAASAIDAGAAEVTRTLEEVQALIRMARGDDRPSSPAATAQAERPRGRPFDILDYKATADSLATASARLESLLREVRTQAQGPELERTLTTVRRQVDPAVEQTAAELTGVIDHLAVRLAQVAGFVFVLAVVWSLLQRRLARQRQPPSA